MKNGLNNSNCTEVHVMKKYFVFFIAVAMMLMLACESSKDGRDGRDGRDGIAGQDGKDGQDGQDGEDAPVSLSRSEKASEEEARENCGEDIVNANWICTGVDENENGYLDDYEFAECHIDCGGAPGKNALVEKKDVTTECPNGGFKLVAGTDFNSNGILDPDEITVEEIVCNGVDGQDGVGDAVRTSTEPAGTNCQNGGQKIERGRDLNRNGQLDVSEITSTNYVCNGIDGTNGHDARTRTSITNDPTLCASGSGVIFESGTDNNDNGVLDDPEVSTTDVICDGADGKTTRMIVATEPAGTNCAVGGFSVVYGVDENDNGLLDTAEQSPAQYICHGQDGYSVVMRVTADIAICSWNGYRLQFGQDLDRNGILDTGEETSDFYICNGSDGLISRINISDEPNSENCAAGGKRVDTGMDINRNGLLDSTEITATNYVCNGVQGPQGVRGYNSLSRITPDLGGTVCTWGGYFLEVGTDINEDWILDSDEVGHSAYVCNGIDGKTCSSILNDEPTGTNCAYGGKIVRSGCDDDYNGVLDLYEVVYTDYICNGATGAIGPAGHNALTNMQIAVSGCPNGGYVFTAGTDANDNQILELTEVTVTNLVCHGVNGQDGYTYRVQMVDEPVSTNCVQGGKAISGGIDSNRNGVLDPSEADDPVYICHGANGLPGANGQNGLSMAFVISVASISECPAGGEKLELGLDIDASGVLELVEVTGTVLICNGQNGQNGKNSLTTMTVEPIGTNCAKGGHLLLVGIDDNENGILDSSEAGVPQYVCHGLDGINGANGTNGHNALAMVTTSTLGFCPNGGSELRTGTDLNDDGVLNAGEVSSFALICNGQNGANGADGYSSRTRMISEPAGANCQAGGFFITSGTDTNNNGALDVAEIEYSGYICNGINGNPGSNAVTRGRLALVSECLNGGSVVETGTDSNNNAVLDDMEVMTISYLCNGDPGTNGQDGISYRVIITNESAGINCQAGGKKLEGGYDTSRNNILDPGEIVMTEYVCNGMDGHEGQDGMNALLRMEDEPAGVNCERGGKAILSGYDLDSDNYLDDTEVLAQSYLCNAKIVYSVGAESTFGTFTAYTASTVSYCKMYGTTLEAVAYISDAGNAAVVATDWEAVECFNTSHVRVNIISCSGSGFTQSNVGVCTYDGSAYARGGLGQTCKPNRSCNNGRVCRLMDTTCVVKPVPGAGEYAFYWDGTMNSGGTTCESYGGNYYSPVVGQWDISGVPNCNADLGDPVRELKFYTGCITDQSDFDTLDPAARHCTGPAYATVLAPW